MALLGLAASVLVATVSAINSDIEHFAMSIAGGATCLMMLALVVIGNVLIDIKQENNND